MRKERLQTSDLPASSWWGFWVRFLKTFEVIIFKLLQSFNLYRGQKSVVGIPSLATRSFTLLQAVVYNGTQDEVLGFRPRRLFYRIVKGLPDVEMFENVRFQLALSENNTRTVEASTETRGFIQLQLPWQLPWHLPDKAWMRLEPGGVETLFGKVQLGDYELLSTPVYFLNQKVKWVIISDIDDTIKDSDIATTTSPKQILKSIFKGHYYTYKPIEGMAQLYQRLVDHGAMVVYLTSTPYQLTPFLLKFLREGNFPEGPVFPRWLGYGKIRHKWRTIHKIISAMEGNTQCVLVGDSGEKDLQIYRRICDNPVFSKHVSKILIRHVPGTPIHEPVDSRELFYRTEEELYKELEFILES